MSVYPFSYRSIEGKEVSLSDYAGKVLLLVNTASKCGFTPQYEGLEKLYQGYKDKGLVIIGFPCNQFGEQEPGTNDDVQEFCKARYGVSFPLSEKVEVRGEHATPLYQHLTANTAFNGFGRGAKAKTLEVFLKARYGKGYRDSSVKWNFTKFLIDKEGNIAGRYEPTVSPEEMEETIKELL